METLETIFLGFSNDRMLVLNPFLHQWSISGKTLAPVNLPCNGQMETSPLRISSSNQSKWSFFGSLRFGFAILGVCPHTRDANGLFTRRFHSNWPLVLRNRWGVGWLFLWTNESLFINSLVLSIMLGLPGNATATFSTGNIILFAQSHGL